MANVPMKDIQFPGLDDTYTFAQIDNTLTQTGQAADAKATGDEISELKADLSQATGILYKGSATNNTILFTSEQVSEGDILYVNMTALSASSATYIELLDENNTRVGLFGKVSGSYGSVRNFGVIVIPEGFHTARMNNAATIKYIQRQFPLDFMTEIQNYTLGSKYDILEGVNWNAKKGVRIGNGVIDTNNPTSVSTHIPVIPHSKITTNINNGSSAWGFGFYDAMLNFVNSIPSNQNNMEFYVPEGAYFIVVTAITTSISSGLHAYLTLPSVAETEKKINEANQYSRYSFGQSGALINGYPHIAFPRVCFFDGKEVVVYRTGYQHLPTTDGTLLAVQQLDTRQPDGTWKHIKSIGASDFTGVSGDARDFYIQPSKDGQYLFMVGSFTHYSDNTAYYDCFIAVLNSDLDIVNYKTFLNNTDYFYGNPLVTPEGHIIFTSYDMNNSVYIYRSDESFSGDVSTLTFTKTAVDTENSAHTESCFGYFNDKLVLVIRYEGTNPAKIMVTSNLEGTSGWSEPVSVGVSIQSPMLLPYYKGNYMPVVGSKYISGSPQNRKPYLYYIDVANTNVIASGDIDDKLVTALSGYPSFAPLGGEKYVVMYYQESSNGTTETYPKVCAQIYYKWVNAREIIPALAYLDV